MRAEPIPQEYIDKGFYRPGVTHYSRTIGVYDYARDCTVAWRCPDCGYEEARGANRTAQPVTGGEKR